MVGIDDSHRLHLIALINRERDVAYQRQPHLSHHEGRADLATNVPRSPSYAVDGGRTTRLRLGSPLSVMSHPPPSSSSYSYPFVASSSSSFSSTSYPVGDGQTAASASRGTRRRERIVEWMYQVVDRLGEYDRTEHSYHFPCICHAPRTMVSCIHRASDDGLVRAADFSRDIVSVSTFYLDKYLAMRNADDDEFFQLSAMASLYLAIKLHSSRKVSARAIASTGNGSFTTGHVEDMELSIIRALDWHLFPPTSISFIENLYPLVVSSSVPSSSSSDHGGGDDVVHGCPVEDSLEFSRFLAELSVCSYPCVSMRPSSIAIASMILGFEYFNVSHEKIGDILRNTIGGLDMNLDHDSIEVRECVILLRGMYALAMPTDLSWDEEKRRHLESTPHPICVRTL
jgi:hypothetical protein